MKEKFLCIAKSIALILALSIVFSLLFAALYYFHVISQNLFHILNWIFGCVAFFLAGVLLANGIKKKALLHAFAIVFGFAILGGFLLPSYELMSIVELASKLFAYVLGVFLVVNRKNA